MQISIKTKALYWITRFVQVQLLISLVSLPIFIAWGMPISMLSPLGNLIFTPFVVSFMALSTLVFFSELTHLPNEWLILCLETVTAWWSWLLELPAKSTWLVGFPTPSVYVLCAIPLAAFLLIQWRKNYSAKRIITGLALLLGITGCYVKLVCTPQRTVQAIPCNRGELTLIKNGHNTALVDPGFVGQRLSAPSWIEYTLRPHLIRTIGSTHINHLIVMQPGKLTFEAIEHLADKLTIDHVYLIIWNGYLPYKDWRSFSTMKKYLAEKNIPLTRIGFKQLTIDPKICIKPLERNIKQGTISYPALSVSYCVDKDWVTIYSAKQKKQLNHEEKNALRQ